MGWLAWDTAALLATGTAVPVVATRGVRSAGAQGLRNAGKELVLVLSLYAVWRWVRLQTIREVHGAVGHGRSVWHVEQWLHLPSEASLQHWFLHHPLWVQAGNGYYALFHVPALIATLVWLFARHRDVYRRLRTCLALTTAAALVLHIVPVAPPRLFPDLGFVDTGLLYKQSVYGPTGGDLSAVYGALPSIHVGWAALVAVGTLAAGRGWWRWIGPVHLVLTVWAVTVTANHWWLDGVLAGALVALAWWAVGQAGTRNQTRLPSGRDSMPHSEASDSTSHTPRPPSASAVGVPTAGVAWERSRTAKVTDGPS